MNHPGHIFALALFAAVGLSHTFRPRIWKDYVAWIASNRHAGVALYASLHALPGAILIAFSGTSDWTGWVLTLLGVSFALKGGVYCLFPDRALRKITWGLSLPDAAWSVAGAAFLALAGIAAWGAFA